MRASSRLTQKQAAELAGLVSELKATAAKAAAAMDRTIARLDTWERHRPEVEAQARAQAEAEFRELDPLRLHQPDKT